MKLIKSNIKIIIFSIIKKMNNLKYYLNSHKFFALNYL